MYVALHRPHGALHFTLYTLHFTHTYRDTKIAPTSARAAHAVHARARAVVHRVAVDAAARAVVDDEASRVETLARWCADRGTFARALRVDLNQGSGRGVETSRDVRAGERVLGASLTSGIVDEARGHPERTRAAMAEAPWGVRLACRVLQERKKGGASAYAAYVATLPERVESSPALYAARAIEEVQYPPAMTEIREMQRATREWHEKLQKTAPEALGDAVFDYDAFVDAVSVVHSRTYGIASANDNAGLFRALLPLADMINHGGDIVTGLTKDEETGEVTNVETTATDNIAWSELDDDGVVHFAATRDIAEGEAALMSYGERSNDHFLIYYGFAPDNNPHDDCVLFSNLEHALAWHSVAHPELWDGPDAEIRERAAKAAYERVTKSLEAEGSVDAKLAAAEPRLKTLSFGRVDARLLSAFAAIFAGTETSGDAAGPVCGDELRFARADVAARCEQLLAQMPTTFAEDLSALRAGECVDDAQRTRFIYRACKKKILADALEMFRIA